MNYRLRKCDAMKWIKGRVKFVDIGPGFYGIVTQDGEELLPINFPEQLKYEAQEIELLTTNADDFMSVFMWGRPVKVHGFKTI